VILLGMPEYWSLAPSDHGGGFCRIRHHTLPLPAPAYDQQPMVVCDKIL
jgi:hypothetical protein